MSGSAALPMIPDFLAYGRAYGWRSAWRNSFHYTIHPELAGIAIACLLWFVILRLIQRWKQRLTK